MTGRIPPKQLQAMNTAQLVDGIVSAASRNNEMDNREEVNSLRRELRRRLEERDLFEEYARLLRTVWLNASQKRCHEMVHDFERANLRTLDPVWTDWQRK